jgi:hypothetical protein
VPLNAFQPHPGLLLWLRGRVLHIVSIVGVPVREESCYAKCSLR